MATDFKPRLAIYGTGQFGQFITRLAVEKGWEVVAAYNRAGPKVGQDLGRLSGLGRDLGVIVQDCDAADYSTLQADVGIVMVSNLLRENLAGYRRLLGAGVNVLCHGTEAYFPHGNDPELAKEIDAMAKANGVTFSGSGIWDMSRIWAGMLLAGPCTRIERLVHTSITDCTRNGKAQMLFTGVGSTPEQFAGMANYHAVLHTYKTIPMQVLAGLGYALTDTTVRVEPVLFDAPILCDLLERDIPPGECVGARIVAEVQTEQGVSAEARIELRLFHEGEVEHMAWTVEGMPVSRIRTEREDSSHATVASLFNRIPDVVAARPGIVLVSEMGPPRPTARL
ncbi:hypothetical protein [Novosphingobium sp. 9U]|uniref:NAD(P)H-dependent amine dehydrogenase family protein n=1 Tax=Novosphingobium sp. 9U TaxID=2653158 RepID=UPI0012EF5D82|nr:hypothetical protein [Novosphingobium sp. 9U]VWX50151.1 4-hydroxy-tetrahydrodipicolinate reductase [Novosphingobium sp. 9U]